MTEPPVVRLAWRPQGPLDVVATLGPLRRGRGDPTFRVDPLGAVWRTSTTPDGPATLRLRRVAGLVLADAWGAGGPWALDAVPDSLGARDDVTGFSPPPGLATETWRRHPGLRLPRTRRVWDVLALAVLEQKVTGVQSRRSWRELISVAGVPAPGPAPAGMRVPPTSQAVLDVPDWVWHRCGVDGQRRRTLRAAATVAPALERAVDLPGTQAVALLRRVPGIGAWTAAEVVQRALGDADHPSVGDYHVPSFVGWALVGHGLDDAGMLDVLEPYRPHRQRVVRLLEASGFRKPRFGPRMTVPDYRTF